MAETPYPDPVDPLPIAALARSVPGGHASMSYELARLEVPARPDSFPLIVSRNHGRPGYNARLVSMPLSYISGLADMAYPTVPYGDYVHVVTSVMFRGIQDQADQQTIESHVLSSWQKSGFYCDSLTIDGISDEEISMFRIYLTQAPRRMPALRLRMRREDAFPFAGRLKRYCMGAKIRYNSAVSQELDEGY